MAQRRWHPESGVNPPFNRTYEDYMGKGELMEHHSKYGHMASFFDLYPESKPKKCTGAPGCGCVACTMRGRMLDRERE